MTSSLKKSVYYYAYYDDNDWENVTNRNTIFRSRHTEPC